MIVQKLLVINKNLKNIQKNFLIYFKEQKQFFYKLNNLMNFP